MWRKLRLLILLLILFVVAVGQYQARVRSTEWRTTLRVAVFPMRADDSATAATFVSKLTPTDFAALEKFFGEQARRYSVSLDAPVRFTLERPVEKRPPVLDPDAGALATLMWSLRARYWAWRVSDVAGPRPHVRLFVLYHDPQRSPSLRHSIGLQKGLFGIVNVFADSDMLGSNDVVVAHELLHTLGATDKYSFVNNQPIYPLGYAEPSREPLLPQRLAELMGGRIPLNESESSIPESLQQVLIGPVTAAEIGWVRQ